MRRRSFIQGAVVAAAASAISGREVFATADDLFESRLLAFAETVVPGADSSTWHCSAVESAMLAAMREPGNRDARRRYSSALETLHSAAGGDFSALSAERRASVLEELISTDKEFAEKFAAMRSDVMRIYFTSEAGMKFTGYRDCTQFEGYPEYFDLAEIWE